ncbi:MAG: hypothetical protein AAFX93_18685 [Verrucomicrobiota bacterium]
MKRIVIIYGPAASGKTLNKDALRDHYKCDYICDAWGGGRHGPSHTFNDGESWLVLAPEALPKWLKKISGEVEISTIPVANASVELGDAWIDPDPAKARESRSMCFRGKRHPVISPVSSPELKLTKAQDDPPQFGIENWDEFNCWARRNHPLWDSVMKRGDQCELHESDTIKLLAAVLLNSHVQAIKELIAARAFLVDQPISFSTKS